LKEKINALFGPLTLLLTVFILVFCIYDGWNLTNQSEKEIRSVLSELGFETKSVSVNVSDMEAYAQTNKGEVYIRNIKNVEDSIYIKND
jgi:hypothetical protein